jgi:threonine dehydratase
MKYKHYIDGIVKANQVLQGNAVKTNVRKLSWLKQYGDFDVVAKFENQQITGSFKYRGAYNFMSQQKKDRPVIAASAGNHALAVAEAGKKFGIKTTICIPTTASSVKKNRLASYPHSLILEGASLEESGKYAIDLAQKEDWDYISPYNNQKIIQGQGTVAIEFLEQTNNLDTLVVPVGGGGLISGVALMAKHIKPDIKIIGVEPELYNTFYTMKHGGGIDKTPNSPTFADGLAVNLEDNSLTPDIIDKFVDEIVTVNEEEIAAGVLAMLYHESQLIEGGGAAGIAAIIAGKIGKDSGKIGVIVSGGNITVSNLSKIINYPFKNQQLINYINTYGEKAATKVALKGIDFSKKHSQLTLSKLDNTQSDDVSDDIRYYNGRYNDAKNKLEKYTTQFNDYIEYCDRKGIVPDSSATAMFKSLNTMASNQLLAFDVNELKIINNPTAYNKKITQLIQQYRSLMHTIMSLSLVLDWRSASYSQSIDTQFFGINSQDNPGVNYNRYESDRLTSLEKQLAQVLGLNQEKTSLLMTSSGMAAYTLLESYLIRYALKPNDTVLIPQYLYFETDEQISGVQGIEVINKNIHNTDEIVELISAIQPKVVFLDPITNTVQLRMTDVYEVIRKTSKLKLEHDVYIAIDGSLMSGELESSKLYNHTNSKLHVIYYDSCSKYLQLGMDIAMGGLVAFPTELAPIFERLRRNTGTILYDFAANIFPSYDRATQKYRMSRMGRNAQIVGQMVENSSDINQDFHAIYPKLKGHSDYKTACKFDSVGGLITFAFTDESLNQRESLNSLIEIILATAKDNGLSITKGVSFGFSIPRISAAAAMAENAIPFLRLSVGDRSISETRLLADTIIQSVKKYLEIKKSEGSLSSTEHQLPKDVINSIYYICPEKTRKHSKVLAKKLSAILKSCYGRDYPGTALDSIKNEKDILSGLQKTAFWAITSEEKAKKQYGTASIVDASHEFGAGYAEMGKSGSLGSGGAKYGYARLLQDWENCNKELSRFSALATTVRNCGDRPGKNKKIVRGGAAVRTMFLKYFKFGQWGIAPWYLMPDDSDGSYEALDLLFRHKNPENNITYLKKEKVVLIGENNQSVLDKFCQHTYNLYPKYATTDGHAKQKPIGWDVIKPSNQANRNLQLMVRARNKVKFDDAFANLQNGECATRSIYVPLIEGTEIVQELLEKSGWVLTGFVPGRMYDNKVEPYQGMWTKLCSNRPIITPLFLHEDVLDTLSPKWYHHWVERTIAKLKTNRETQS